MLQQSDYDSIGVVATHCDTRKLVIAENEALNFDLKELYCDFWNDLIIIWEEINAYILAVAECEADPECSTPPTPPENYLYKLRLINGGTYQNCNSKERRFEGVKRVLLYYSYSRYVILNGFNDTPTGVVQKINEFSLPTPIKDLQAYADKYRNMGYASFKDTVGYLCANRDYFTWTDCKLCGCGCSKCSGTKAKGYGLKGRTITKDV